MSGGFIVNDAPVTASVTAASIAAAVADPEDAATVRGALQGREADDLSGTGWSATATSGGATATWGTGPARLSIAVPSSTQGGAGVERAALLPEGVDAWDVLCRLDVTLGDSSDRTRITLAAGASATNHVLMSLWTNGVVELAKEVATDSPTFTSLGYGAATGLDATARTGGQLWLRLSLRPGRVLVSWGVGAAGAVPTSWRTVRESTDENAAAVAHGTYVKLTGGTTDNTVAAGLAVDILAIHAVGQTAGPL